MTGSRSEKETTGGLLGEAVRQTGWSTLEKVANHGLRFLFLIALARLLAPDAFGLFAEAMVVTSLLGTVATLGLETSLVQRDAAEDADFTTAAWTSSALAVTLLAGAAALAPLAAWTFQSPVLGAIVPAAALGPALRNLSLSPRADLRRRMDFRSLSLASLVGTALGGGVAVLLAYRGHGVWSLVAQLVVDSLVTTTWVWAASRVHLGRRFSWSRFEQLVQFGGPFTGEQLLNFVNRRADDFVIGVFLGDTALGFYRIAYTALEALTRVLSGSLTAVALPVFSTASSDRSRLRDQFLRATEYAALVAVPVTAGFAAVVDLAIPVFYGSGWLPSVKPALILSLVALIDSILLLTPTAMYALGRSDLQLRLTALYAVLNAIGFLIGVQWGIVGVAAAYAIQTVLTAPVGLGVLKGLIEFRVTDYMRSLWRPVLATAVMLAAVAAGRVLLEIGNTGELAFSVALGAVVYAAALYATGPTYVVELVRRFTSAAQT